MSEETHLTRLLECPEFGERGAPLGSGLTRDVYAHAHDPNLVVKASRFGYHSNVVENHVWTELWNVPEASRWLAPCVRLSLDGLVLHQRRVRPLTESERTSVTELPEFLRDVKTENFGVLEGRIVCCDYAVVRLWASCRLVSTELGDD